MERREGYLAVTLDVPGDLEGLSERAGALLGAFPEQNGRRTVRVDVRNRHWAALILELAGASRLRETAGDA